MQPVITRNILKQPTSSMLKQMLAELAGHPLGGNALIPPPGMFEIGNYCKTIVKEYSANHKFKYHNPVQVDANSSRVVIYTVGLTTNVRTEYIEFKPIKEY